jgi:hypothetical protein
VVSGNPMTEITRLLSSKDIQVSVQNQALQVRRKREPLQKEAISLSANSCLIATPEIGSKGKMTVRALLMAGLLPGRKVHIDSAVFRGFAIIQKVRFIGANFGKEWEAEMECKVG